MTNDITAHVLLDLMQCDPFGEVFVSERGHGKLCSDARRQTFQPKTTPRVI